MDLRGKKHEERKTDIGKDGSFEIHDLFMNFKMLWIGFCSNFKSVTQ